MKNLEAFKARIRATAQYYPVEYDVIYGWNADTRTWQSWSIKMDQGHEKELAAAAKADGGRITRRNGWFIN